MLELLEYTDKIWDCPNLKNVAVIGAQHIMESTLCLFRNLEKNGLNPDNVFLLGKCYSTSPSVYEDFKKSGFRVSPLSFSYDSHQSFDELYKQNIRLFLLEAVRCLDLTNVEKIILLDDGGYLIQAIHSIDLPQVPVVCIEQTSAGIHHLKDLELGLPVLNVARSQAKLVLETPFIVESVLNRFFQYFTPLQIRNKTILILGYGVVGRVLEQQLTQLCNILVFDPAYPNRLSFQECLSQADVVLGCSGSTSLRYEDYKSLKEGAILVSVSSSDREFESHLFRQQFPQNEDCLLSFQGKIHLVQSGFPINFWRERNNMSLDKIQITMALLSSAIYQATSEKLSASGIISINVDAEKQIMSKFVEISCLKSPSREKIYPLSNLGQLNATSIGARHYQKVSSYSAY